MEDASVLIINEEEEIAAINDNPKECKDDSYACITCPYPVEILKIDDSENTITFKCLNPKKKEKEKTIPISEYLESMKK